MKPNSVVMTCSLPDGREISIETGKLARQADGSVVLKMGNTMILATAVASQDPKEGADFLPLSVDYQEKFASTGRIPGGFLKRESKLSDYEILISRLVDRAIRPLFPDDYHAETQVNIQLISGDLDSLPDALAAFAASSAASNASLSVCSPSVISTIALSRPSPASNAFTLAANSSAPSGGDAGSAGGLHCGGTEIVVGPGGFLRMVNLQNWSAGVWHFARQKAVVHSGGRLQWTLGALGSRLSQVAQDVALVGRGAEAQVNGVMFTEGRQQLVYNTLQHHESPACRSDLLYKGALQDRSRLVWRGMIKVDKAAQKTDGYQRNDNLMLSNEARADSIPGLEIEADDVRCTHGATSGRVDAEQLFYARARGLSADEAARPDAGGDLGERGPRADDDLVPFRGDARQADAMRGRRLRPAADHQRCLGLDRVLLERVGLDLRLLELAVVVDLHALGLHRHGEVQHRGAARRIVGDVDVEPGFLGLVGDGGEVRDSIGEAYGTPLVLRRDDRVADRLSDVCASRVDPEIPEPRGQWDRLTSSIDDDHLGDDTHVGAGVVEGELTGDLWRFPDHKIQLIGLIREHERHRDRIGSDQIGRAHV